MEKQKVREDRLVKTLVDGKVSSKEYIELAEAGDFIDFKWCEPLLHGQKYATFTAYILRDETDEEYNTRITAIDNARKNLLKWKIRDANETIKSAHSELEELKELYR